MNYKKLFAQQSHFLALANMHVDEMMYRQKLNHPEVMINTYLGPIQSYLAEHDQIVGQLRQLDEDDSRPTS